MMKFKYLEDVAIADIAFEAYGKDLNELFENCALALSDCMVNSKEIKIKAKKEIKLKSEKLEGLLYDFLSEIIFIKDTDGILFSKYKITIRANNGFELNAICQGDKIDYEKFELRNDVKAVTMHMFEIKKIGKNYKATVVVDI
ncbi:archease [Candidatus Woesearchaeota archaeon]|nr:archease [Candidatus Woesearchaeota archaeon]